MRSALIFLAVLIVTSGAHAKGEFELGYARRFDRSSSFDSFAGARASAYYSAPTDEKKLSGLNELSFRAFYPKRSHWQFGAHLDWILPGSASVVVHPISESAVTKKSSVRGWMLGPTFLYTPPKWGRKGVPLSFGLEPSVGLLALSQEWNGSSSGKISAQALSYRANLFASYLVSLSPRFGFTARAGYSLQGSSEYLVTKSEGTIYQDLPKGTAVNLDDGSGKRRLTTIFHGPYVALSAHLNTHPAAEETPSEGTGPAFDAEKPASQEALPPPPALLPEDGLESLPFLRLYP